MNISLQFSAAVRLLVLCAMLLVLTMIPPTLARASDDMMMTSSSGTPAVHAAHHNMANANVAARQADDACGGTCTDPNAMCLVDGSCQCLYDSSMYYDGSTPCPGSGPWDSCASVMCDSNAQCDSGTCTCNSGYTGDGTTCTADSPMDACTSTCDSNAQCSFGSCTCNDGYTGDGTTCTTVDNGPSGSKAIAVTVYDSTDCTGSQLVSRTEFTGGEGVCQSLMVQGTTYYGKLFCTADDTPELTVCGTDSSCNPSTCQTISLFSVANNCVAAFGGSGKFTCGSSAASVGSFAGSAASVGSSAPRQTASSVGAVVAMATAAILVVQVMVA